jgi:putative NIF3 family GTP cyclohydrolase 1 type 2
LHTIAHDRRIKIAICPGSTQKFIKYAYDAGADVYISRKFSEEAFCIAKVLNISYIVIECDEVVSYSIKKLGNHLRDEFNLIHTFINKETFA